jgi:TetR/AcrR family transcriptional repressor of lmrAB and yxaGH operons
MKKYTATTTSKRLIDAMIDALRTRGYHGIGINDLLIKADTPKGVLYHHFPGGKSELAITAINTVTSTILSDLQTITTQSDDVLTAMTLWMNASLNMLEKSGYQIGCPLATIALESTAEDIAIRQAINNAFNLLRAQLTSTLEQGGLTNQLARTTASLIISAYEGALLQARVAENTTTMRETIDALSHFIRLNRSNTST